MNSFPSFLTCINICLVPFFPFNEQSVSTTRRNEYHTDDQPVDSPPNLPFQLEADHTDDDDVNTPFERPDDRAMNNNGDHRYSYREPSPPRILSYWAPSFLNTGSDPIMAGDIPTISALTRAPSWRRGRNDNVSILLSQRCQAMILSPVYCLLRIDAVSWKRMLMGVLSDGRLDIAIS